MSIAQHGNIFAAELNVVHEVKEGGSAILVAFGECVLTIDGVSYNLAIGRTLDQEGWISWKDACASERYADEETGKRTYIERYVFTEEIIQRYLESIQ